MEQAKKDSSPQKLKQVPERCVRMFDSFEPADIIRKLTVDSLKQANLTQYVVKVRARPAGTFDMLVFAPIKTEAKQG